MIFRYLARLMMVVPGATIHTFMDFVANPETTVPYYDKLDRTTRLFFQTQFANRTFDETRQQILTRLWIILSNGILERMFSSEKNAINLFSAMNSGSLILINTAKDLLKQDGCELLGRFFIALIAQATQERAIIPPEKRRATFVYIDEAHDYFDESLGDMLNQARKFKVGLVFAHQNLDQLDASLRATVMSSTSIKIFGGLSAKDTNVFAQELGEQPGCVYRLICAEAGRTPRSGKRYSAGDSDGGADAANPPSPSTLANGATRPPPAPVAQ